jgi:zinc/manganese transport system permease protein/iron/zinc/copper transport system permease protein
MSSFFELLMIYKWSLPASIVAAGILSLVGAQWTARGQSAQIFVLSQGSSLGVVLGLILNIIFGTDLHFLNLILGFSLGWLTLLLSNRLTGSRSDRNHVYLTLFVFFLGLTYLLTSLTPSLESHMAAAYFGDLAVMSDTQSQIVLIIGILSLVFVLKEWKNLSLTSFQLSNSSMIHRRWKNGAFELITLIVTAASVQNMGYLFTIGSLFIGTSFAAHRSRNLQAYTQKMLFIAVTGSFTGFLVSLLSTNLPTVPCVIIGQIAVGIVSYVKK